MRRILNSWHLLPIILAILSLYYVVVVRSYWFPWDEGSMAYMAQRVLAGDLAHRDFMDTYTGGINYFHAIAFQLFGHDFLTLRFVLAFSYIIGLAVFFWISAQLFPFYISGLLTLAAGLLGPNLYAAPMPSWYVLLLGFWSLAFIVVHARRQSAWFLIFAGVFSGFSVLAKITGLYVVAAILLYLVYSEQQKAKGHRGSPYIFKGIKIITLTCFLLLVFKLLSPQLHVSELVVWFCPVAILVGYIIYDDWDTGKTDIQRFSTLLQSTVPYALGSLIPISIYIGYYALIGEIHSLWEGLFVKPQRRLELETTSGALQPIWVCAMGTLLTALVLLSGWRKWQTTIMAVTICGVVLWLVLGAKSIPYINFWYWLRSMPLLAIVVFLYSQSFQSTEHAPLQKSLTFLVLATASMVALTQYPFPHGVYLLYCAPFLLLSYFATVFLCNRATEKSIALCLVFIILFSQIWLARGALGPLGLVHKPKMVVAPLEIKGAGIFVEQRVSLLYQTVVKLITERASAKTLYAGPDSPEIYYLTQTINSSGTLYDVFEEDYANAESFEQRKLDAIREAQYDALVINMKPAFSRAPSPRFLSELEKDYNAWAIVGPFRVAWKQ